MDLSALALDDLHVTVPVPPEVTRPELLERYEALVRARFPRAPRAAGEPVAPGDEVVVDVVTLHDDHVVPFGARRALVGVVAAEGPLGALWAGLVGAPVGGRARVTALVPFDAPQEALRGEIVTYDVTVRSAAAVGFVDPETPEGWAALGFDGSMADVMAALLDDLRQERCGEAAAVARERALDTLARRAGVVVPPALLEDELGRRWWEAEGSLLAERGVGLGEQERAWAAWRAAPGLVAEVERRLAAALLAAAAGRDGALGTDGLGPDGLGPEDVTPWLRLLAAAVGVTEAEARAALRADPAAAEATLRTVHRAKVVDRLLRHLVVDLAP